MEALTLAPAAPDLKAFVATLRGRAILPSDEAYDEARQLHNTAFDRRPAVIVKAAGPDDVSRAIRFAAETGREIAVRSGGHSFAGYSVVDNAVVIDLGAMKGLHIDVERQLVWAQTGLTSGEVTAATSVHGLIVPFGDTHSVGIGGITLGGGLGWLSRKHGMTIDHVVAAEVVLADGSIVTASETDHPDLFWAIRGGGGNFGVVTRFQYRLVPVDLVVGGALFLPATPEVIRGLIDAGKAAPDELSMIADMLPLPPLPFVPEDKVGQLTFIVSMVYDGDIEAGMQAVEPFRRIAQPIADMVGPMPYPKMYELFAEGANRGGLVSRSFFADDIDQGSAEAMLDFMTNRASPMAMTQIRVLGGQVARTPVDATAFAHRNRDVLVALVAMFEEPDEAYGNWVQAYFEAVRPIANGVYVNFLEHEPDRIGDAYPTATYARLAEVKRRYDPRNLFHLNQNIRPD